MSETNSQTADTSSNKSKSVAFITAWKKRAGYTVQQSLQTKSEAFIASCLAEGWTIRDVRSWTTLAERAKYSRMSDHDHYEVLKLLHGTLDMAEHLGVHPVGLICYARCELSQPEWSLSALKVVKDKFYGDEYEISTMPDSDEHSDDAPTEVDDVKLVCPGAPKKRRVLEETPTQPQSPIEHGTTESE